MAILSVLCAKGKGGRQNLEDSSALISEVIESAFFSCNHFPDTPFSLKLKVSVNIVTK